MRQRITILDGAMGTVLQAGGLGAGERLEALCITSPERVEQVHRRYVQAGAGMILASTFGAHEHNLAGTPFSVEEVVTAAVHVARRACEGTDTVVALDVGPTGKMMEPLGPMRQEEAYAAFARIIRAGVQAGAQAIFFETFSDLSELRSGILAAKDLCELPIFACMTFEKGGCTFLGVRADAAAMALSALGVTAVGMNCSLGPQEAAPILHAMRTCTDLPLIFKPNAGMPDPQTGAYGVDAEAFARACEAIPGIAYVGGCCGTTPDYIAALAERLSDRVAEWEGKTVHGVCSAGEVCAFGRGVRIVGERINPTGKPRLAQALRALDMDYIVSQAQEQAQAGAQILDINVGLPGIDEPETMRRVVQAVSAAVSLPLQIDSSDPEAIEAGLRVAPGKCLINSVSASSSSMQALFPLARRYGAALVCLTMGEEGVPDTAQGRLDLAQRIVAAALDAGIPREDLVIDCLALTVSAQQDQTAQTLEAVRRVRSELGLETMLGVSNVSFGLPEKQHVTQAFLAQALCCGLTLPILNPNQPETMAMVDACRVLSGEDEGCSAYVQRHAQAVRHVQDARTPLSLERAVILGLREEAAALACELLRTAAPVDVVEQHLMPALDEVGQQYEQQQLFLPQLMRASAAAGAAFEQVRKAMADRGGAQTKRGPVVLATVEGDIHDIGRDIVRMVLENDGFSVVDLGHDVSAARVVEAVRACGAKLVGLSALMTASVSAMKKTIATMRESGLCVPVVAGGAVLTADCAAQIGADFYAADARQTAEIARRVTGFEEEKGQ